jgi:hypothetical protein
LILNFFRLQRKKDIQLYLYQQRRFDEMRIVAMIDKSDGSDTIYNMWTATKTFDQSASLKDVYAWVNDVLNNPHHLWDVRFNVRLSIDQESVGRVE